MKKIMMIAAAAVLAFTAMSCKNAPKYELTDGEWMLISWNDEGGEEMMVTANRPTMKFDAEMKVHGFAGCNQFNGRYEVTGQTIKIDMGAMTMKMCMDMTTENHMVMLMPNVVHFEIEGNQLILSNKDNKELFRFDNTVVPADNQ